MLQDLKINNNKIIGKIIILALALMAAVSLYAGAKNAFYYSQDFQWDAAKALWQKIDPYELSLHPGDDYQSEELGEFYKLFTDKGLKQKMEANQFPSLLLLLVPYTFMPPFAARIAWLFSNVLFTIGIIALLRKTFLAKLSTFEFATVSLLMIAGTPYRNQLGVGQHTLFSFFFFLLAVYFDRRKKSSADSFVITLSLFVSYFKYTLTAPLALYFIYRKRYKELIISALMHAVLTIVLAIRMGKSVLYMITAPLQVAMNLSGEGGIDIGAIVGGGKLSLVIAAVVGILLLILCIKMPEGLDNYIVTVLIFWSLILTYHRTYDFFVLSAAVMMFTDEKNKKLLFAYYWLVIFAVYFGLRLFNENTPSRIVVGVMYYILTVLITYFAVKSGRIKSNE